MACRAPHQLFLYMEVPHRITDLMEEPGSLARGVPFEWLGFDAFGHQNMLGSSWIMLDLQILSTTLDNSGGMLLVYPWRLLYIHHHSPYFKPGSWPTSVYVFHWPRTQPGFASKNRVALSLDFPINHVTTICPCLVFWERPTIQQAVQQVASCRASGRKGRWMLGGWFSKNLPCLCFHVWHCLYGKDDLDWFEIVWTCLMFWTTLLGTTFDVSFILGFIHRELVIGGDFTCHLLAAWTLKSPPKADNWRNWNTQNPPIWLQSLVPSSSTPKVHNLAQAPTQGTCWPGRSSRFVIQKDRNVWKNTQVARDSHSVSDNILVGGIPNVYLPFWKIWKSVKLIIPNIWKNKNMFQSTNQYIIPTEHQ